MSGGTGDSAGSLAAEVLGRLRDRSATLATAESLTGGGLAATLTDVPGASESFVGGVVSYATSVKTTLLGVSEDLVSEHGVISAECAEAMADGARRHLGATYALSTTGVAGPDPQEGYPPGTVYVAVAGPEGSEGRALTLSGDRAEIRTATIRAALRALLGVLSPEEPGLG